MIQSRLKNLVLEDVDGSFTLFSRRQISLGILQINVGKAASDMRVFDPEAAEALEGFHADLVAIDRETAYLGGLDVYQDFRAWRRTESERSGKPLPEPERPHLELVSDTSGGALPTGVSPAKADPDWNAARAEVEVQAEEEPIVSPEELSEALEEGSTGPE
jgi:hypothetical protein